MSFLTSSETVAKFQYFCGIVPQDGHPPTGKKRRASFMMGDSPELLNVTRIRRSMSQPPDSKTTTEKPIVKDYTIKNKPLWLIFKGASLFVSELFYITFWPFWLWNMDGYVCRRLCIYWFTFMYLGQAAKDVLKKPRPKSPPVFQLEGRYALEYGFPSTHAMAGAGIPFGLVILHMQRCTYNYEYAMIGAIFCCLFVAFSRLYLGMHSILDVLAGITFALLIGLATFPVLDPINHFLICHPYSPWICFLMPLVLSLCYPTLKKWSTARGDTCLILSMSGGAFFGFWLLNHYGLVQDSNDPPFYQNQELTTHLFGLMLLRFLVGSVVLYTVRAAMKTLSFTTMCYLVGVSKDEERSKRKLLVEVPYKYVTYFSVGFMGVYFVPQLYKHLGIERLDFFTEPF